MLTWLAVWIATLLLEALVYLSITRRAATNSIARRFVFVFVAVVVVASTVALLRHDWRLWLIPSLFVTYQLINIARAISYRLQPDFLRSISLHTLLWLAAYQATALTVSWLVLRNNLQSSLPTVITLIQSLSAVLLLQVTIRMWRQAKPSAQPTPLADSELPSLSVLIPARNETIDLQNCLERLIESDYPKLEIIALDDNSANRRTPEIIRGFAHQGVRFIEGDEPPEQWLAKNHAYNRLFQESSGELVLFCGVDVLVEPQTLRRLVEVFTAERKAMLSILPLRPASENRQLSFIQAMRYWWEIGWPRRSSHPPVLSTLWLMRADALKQAGGFKAAARMITPEAYFARDTARHDGYLFMRSTPSLPVYSTKTIRQQYSTVVRVRYPQLHRRLSLVAAVALFETFILIGPYIFLCLCLMFSFGLIPTLLSSFAIICLSSMYYIIGIRTHLNNLWLGLLTAPIAFTLDVFMVHNSMLKYEFGEVVWHDRNISHPMQQVINASELFGAQREQT